MKLLIARVQEYLAAEHQKRQEFYEWLTPELRAECINGEIVMYSPAKKRYLRVNKRLFNLLENYVTLKGEVDTEKALVVLTRNDYEPDICYWKPEKAASFDDETMPHPAPDLVVEVLSQSTSHWDRGIKFPDHSVFGWWVLGYFSPL